jgi:hypothetical protein
MLLLDSKSSQNSIDPIIKRLLKLKESIILAYKELSNHSFIIQSDFDFISEVAYVSKPLELAVNELSKKDRDTLISKGVLRF